MREQQTAAESTDQGGVPNQDPFMLRFTEITEMGLDSVRSRGLDIGKTE